MYIAVTCKYLDAKWIRFKVLALSRPPGETVTLSARKVRGVFSKPGVHVLLCTTLLSRAHAAVLYAASNSTLVAALPQNTHLLATHTLVKLQTMSRITDE